MSNPANLSGLITLTEPEKRLLCRVAGYMIPASAAHQMPAASDDVIFTDIIASLGRDGPAVRQALVCIETLVGTAGEIGGALAQFRRLHPKLAATLSMIVAQCYYRDDRVMRAIGMEPRPPFPKGFQVEPGDLSLLDAVRARGAIYRRDR